LKINNKLSSLISLIYEKEHHLLPFLNVFRNDIKKLSFVELDESQTALIVLKNKKFEIIVNINFIKRYQLDDEDILWVLCHEISHFVLDHFNAPENTLYAHYFCNLMLDCQVNSMLFNINSRKRIPLFDKIYEDGFEKFIDGREPDNYEFLLVPPNGNKTEINAKLIASGIDNKKSEIMTKFWFENFSTTPLSLTEIAEYLEQILPADESDIHTSEDPPTSDEYPETIKEISDSILNYNDEVINDSKVLQTDYFERNFDLSNIKNDKYKIAILSRAIKESVFEDKYCLESNSTVYDLRGMLPTPSRKEMVLLSTGTIPFHYNNFAPNFEATTAIYIDFSISTITYHEEICKCISSLRNLFGGPYYAFTNEVEEISFDDVVKGSFRVSFTNIDPVLTHINENKIKKALIITDGEFSEPIGYTSAELYIILFSRNNNMDSLRNNHKIKKIWFLK
jgi:hypothetical protein